MQTRIQKWGNSLLLHIPKVVATETGIDAGSTVDVAVEDGKIVVRPTARKYELEELVAMITDENIHEAVESGEAVGKETW